MDYLAGMKPPGCNDPSTLALVGSKLAHILAPMQPPRLVRIKTLAGGLLAIRFVCTADFARPDRMTLANGTVIESVKYTSSLREPGRIQQVSVRLEPLLHWQKVQ